MPQRADIKTGYSCNNNCVHCVVGNKRGAPDWTTGKYKKELEESRKAGADEVVITGGEPTIRPDFLELVRYAKSMGFNLIQLQTNGRMFCDREFTRKTIEAGVNEFAIALHAHIAEIHDSITRVKGSFDQTVEGIRNVSKFRPGVIVNGIVVVTRYNYKFLPEIADFLISLGVGQLQYDFVHPMGNAYKYYDKVVPKISDVLPFIENGIRIAESKNTIIHIEAIPPCLLPGHEKNIVEFNMPPTELREIGRFDPNFNETKIKYGKIKGPQCKECKYDPVCEGLWKEYPEKMGFGELLPVKGEKIMSTESVLENINHRQS